MTLRAASDMDDESFIASLPWHDTQIELPPEGETILVELLGCKLGQYYFMEARSSEGLGHIKRWARANDVLDWKFGKKALERHKKEIQNDSQS